LAEVTDTRPRPEYGEYASPAEQAEAMGISEAELAAVTAPKPAPGKPADEVEAKIEPTADLLPPPRPEDAIPLPPPPAPAAAKNRRWDRAATYAMLFVGIYWLVVFTASFRDLGTAMEQTTKMLDLGEFTSFALADSFGFWLSIIVPVVYVITAGIAIVRVRAGKLAFFVPLIGAGVGGVITLVFFTILMYSDPALSAAFQSGQ
jgi:hypothetical protein